MRAIEFRTVVEDGVIKLPASCRAELSGPVKVIILKEERTEAADIIDRLLASPLKGIDFKPFTREQIYGSED